MTLPSFFFLRIKIIFLSYNIRVMDAKVTLSFNKEVISSAKAFAEQHNISLSRLTEYLYSRIVSKDYKSLDSLPIADWVNEIAEGKAEYHTKSRKISKSDFYEKK